MGASSMRRAALLQRRRSLGNADPLSLMAGLLAVRRDAGGAVAWRHVMGISGL